MNLKTSFPLLLIFLVATLFGTTQPSSAIAPDQGPSAFGQGGFTHFTPFGIERWTYSFEAFANKNGHARGRATFNISDNFTQTEVVVRIKCLNVTSSGGQATVVGTVLHSDDPQFPKRSDVFFIALDGSSGPDFITLLLRFNESDCEPDLVPLTMFAQSPDAIHIEP